MWQDQRLECKVGVTNVCLKPLTMLVCQRVTKTYMHSLTISIVPYNSQERHMEAAAELTSGERWSVHVKENDCNDDGNPGRAEARERREFGTYFQLQHLLLISLNICWESTNLHCSRNSYKEILLPNFTEERNKARNYVLAQDPSATKEGSQDNNPRTITTTQKHALNQ